MIEEDMETYTVSFVRNCIHEFYFLPSDTNVLSKRLSNFQTSSAAWDISLILLTLCIEENCLSPFLQRLIKNLPKEPVEFIQDKALKNVVGFFSAQTICTLCQVDFKGGYPKSSTLEYDTLPNDSPRLFVQRILREFISAFSYSSPLACPILRQLIQAAVACFLFNCLEYISTSPGTNVLQNIGENGILIQFIHPYMESSLLYEACLDILALLPTEVSKNRQLALTTDQRHLLTNYLLNCISLVFNMVFQIYSAFLQKPLNSSTETSYYLKAARQWFSEETCPSYASFNITHLLQCLKNDKWIFDLLTPITITTPDVTFQQIRFLVLQCYFSWIEVITEDRQAFTETSFTIVSNDTLPDPFDKQNRSTLHDAKILLQSSSLPIVLFEFAFITSSLLYSLQNNKETFSSNTPTSRGIIDDKDMIDLQSSMTIRLLQTAANTLIEFLEWMFVIYASHSPYTLGYKEEETKDSDKTPLLSLLNWTNFEPLLCIFYTVSHINALIHFTSYDPQSNSFSLNIFSQIPIPLLCIFLSLLAKFAEVFLPALMYSIHNNMLTAEDFITSPGFLPCYTVNLFISPNNLSESQNFLNKASSLLQSTLQFLHSPSLTIRHLVLDFWYSLVGNQFILQQAQFELSQNNSFFSKNEENTTSSHYERLHAPFVASSFVSLVEHVLDVSTYPADLAQREHSFPFMAWIKFRDDCSVTLTDATTVLCLNSILDKTGKLFNELLSQQKMNPSFNHCRKIESCLFLLAAIAPRAKAGLDVYIPLALNALPMLPYHLKSDSESFVMIIAASRLMVWTTGYIGMKPKLFAKCFQLLQSFVPRILTSNTTSHHATCDSNNICCFKSLVQYVERVLIEAIHSLVTAAASTIASDEKVPESDITFVLTGLTECVLLDTLSMESRCSLVVCAGAFLQCLSSSKMQKYHYQLAKTLQNHIFDNVPLEETSFLSKKKTEYLKLFFTTIESVQPTKKVPSPSYSHYAVPLEPSSEFRHPVLNVLEEFWPLFQKCLLEFSSSEVIVESVFHCITQTFSKFPEHAVRYSCFSSFLDCLEQSFVQSITIFHLAALRSVRRFTLGTFGRNNEEPIICYLIKCTFTCTACVLNTLNKEGVQNYISQSPDIVGMTLDCINTALTSPQISLRLLDADLFYDILVLCINFTPQCPHPKVFMTMLLLLTRFCVWLEPSRFMETFSNSAFQKEKKFSSFANMEALFSKCSTKAREACERHSLLSRILFSVMQAVTEIFQGNAQWIGIVATLFMNLLRIPHLREITQATLRKTLEETYLFENNMCVLNDFCEVLNAPEISQTHPFICRALQELASQAEIQWQHRQYRQLQTTPT